jgi:hypothetical protein
VNSVLPPGKENKQKTNAVVSIQVAFNIPAGANASEACSGRLPVGIATGSRKLKGKTTTAYTFRPARFASGHWIGGVCAVWAFIPIAKELTGVQRLVVVDFKGNKSIKPFKIVKGLLIWTPTAGKTGVSTGAQKGPYSFRNWVDLTNMGWGFVLPPNNKIATVTTSGPIAMTCPAPFGSVQLPADGLDFSTSHVFSSSGGSLSGIHKDSLGQNLVIDANYSFARPAPEAPVSSFRLRGTISAVNPLNGLRELVSGCSSDLIQLGISYGPFDNGDKVRGEPR